MDDDIYDYDDGYEEQDEANDQEIEMENLFYEGEDLMRNQPEAALEKFLKLIELEKDAGNQAKWRFKSLLNVIILSFRLQRTETIETEVKEILSLMSTVSRNDANDTLSKIFDSIFLLTDVRVVMSLSKGILNYLKNNKYEQLYFNAGTKLCKLCNDKGYTENLEEILRELETMADVCFKNKIIDQNKRNSLLFEIYALEFRFLEAKDRFDEIIVKYNQKLKDLATSVFDPLTKAILEETKGKVLLLEKNWEKADSALIEAFKAYLEVGNPKAKTLLKYAFVSSILSNSKINHAYNVEAKTYKDDPEIRAMMNLREAFEQNDFKRFHKIFLSPQIGINNDPFLTRIQDDIQVIVWKEITKSILQSYSFVRISSLAKELRTTESNVRKILIELILSNEIKGLINDVEGIFENHEKIFEKKTIERNQALGLWVDRLKKLYVEPR
eukprot:TRINITY_DN3903_c0_g1_i10.p1 TRINITY_DN3903_c0_g1~~TRINITY_DN3903_c0_g1_i10.p1  ORF type:complete len:442 (+),score=126.30 TRINITY_DN3903_c0_g1_i10:42-1367(+)